jgi:hypothetical protein
MAAAIPAAIGVGSSIFGNISGKGAAKEQRKLAQQFLEMNKPFLQNQLNLSNMSLDALSRNLNPLLASYLTGAEGAEGLGDMLTGQYGSLLGDATGYADAAARGLTDVQNFVRPFMTSGRRAIDEFLPTARRTFENIAPEVGNINQGQQSAQDYVAKFAPRGGGRISTMAKGDLDRQRQINDTFFQSRLATQGQGLQAAFQGAQGLTSASNSLRDLFQARSGVAQNAVGLGLNAKNLGLNNRQGLAGLLQALAGASNQAGSALPGLYNAQANRAYGVDANQRQGSGLGGFLVDLFSNKKVQGGVDDLFGKIGGVFSGGRNPSPIYGAGSNWPM